MDSLFSGFKIINPLWLINNFFTLWGSNNTGAGSSQKGGGSTKGNGSGTKTTVTVVPKPKPNPTPTPGVTPTPPQNDNTIGGSSSGSGRRTPRPSTPTSTVTDIDIIQTNVGKEEQMYMRAKTIQFDAEGLKPNTRYYAFFNDVFVGGNCSTVSGQRSSPLVTNSLGRISGNFYLPAQTFVSGSATFMLVDSVIDDANDNPIPAVGHTSAETIYQSTGILKNFQTSITSTVVSPLADVRPIRCGTAPEPGPGGPRVVKPLPEPTPKASPDTNPNPGACPKAAPPLVNVWRRTVTTRVPQTNNKGQPVYTNQFGAVVSNNLANNFNSKGRTPAMTTSTTTETRRLPVSAGTPPNSVNTSTKTYGSWSLQSASVPDPSYKPPTAGIGVDPIAQSFRVDPSVFPNGLFITQIVVYFRTVDKSSPVTLELRTMSNGLPSPAMLPDAKVVVPGPVIEASETATVGTTFTFNQPIYLIAGEEYCFVLKTPSLGYELWCSRFGSPDIVSNTLITDQPFSGVLFKSANDSTWTPDQYEDVKFEMYSAKFDTEATSNLIFRPHRRKLSPSEMVSGRTYVIGVVGDTNWLDLGAAENTTETAFVYNGETPAPLASGEVAGYAYDVYYNTGATILYSDLSTTNNSGVVNVQSTAHGLKTNDKILIEELPFTSQFVGYISGTVLTVTQMNYGEINVDDYITGTDVNAGMRVTSRVSGTTGGVGQYNLNIGDTVGNDETLVPLVASRDVINGIVTGNLVGEFQVTVVDDDNFNITAKNSDVADRTGPVVISDFLPLIDTTPPPIRRPFVYLPNEDIQTTSSPTNSPATVPSIDGQLLDKPAAPINVGQYSFKMYSNIKVNEVMIDYLGTELETTNIVERIKLATSKSTDGTETEYEETSYVEVDKEGVFYSFDEPRLIATPLNEDVHNLTLNGPSALVNINMTSDDPSVSPVIDTAAVSLIVKTYVIDNQDDELDGLTTLGDFNDEAINSEINSGTGKAAAKYKTRILDLREAYIGLSIYVNANCPSPAKIDCYVRTSNDSTTHMDEDWVWVPLDGVNVGSFEYSPDKDTINEYFFSYTAAESFTVYDMKFVMRSTNNSVVPKIYSIRSMANFE